ncbi:hypothetical protein D9V41_03785 [Aeromicrobium phragmitis]|uniref:DUF6318 domain-containing protein n=2 Tax=Aeromicrobium phragmitis TaxID=2478914 RepID=A0A3L8PNL1_9ACTN|nr:DUF6318 family protein [Aeromicrobium phragmitis]RLV56900.1 hypothetical protein D9V41_03785 [Aeromicrobium phragmitis]
MAAAVLLLAGCSGAPPDEQPTPTATASPTHAPPTMPELALDDSPAGAEAFVRHYIDVLNYAALTGDTSTLEELSSPECDGCRSYVDSIVETYRSGGYIRDESWRVEDVESESVEAGVDVFAQVHVSAATFRESRESTEKASTPYRDSLRLTVSMTGDGDQWRVLAFVRSKA